MSGATGALCAVLANELCATSGTSNRLLDCKDCIRLIIEKGDHCDDHVAVNRQELAMPPSLKLDQIVDFNRYLIRAILNGRGDEIIDLARTNLFR